MNDALATWVTTLESQRLPALTQNVKRLKMLGSRDDTHLGKMAAVIESDPALTLHFIRYINNINHKHLSQGLSSVHHSLMMMGINNVKKITQNIDTLETQPKESQRCLLKHFSQALHAGVQVRQFARIIREIAADELYLATLLHNLGAMLLDLHAPKEMAQVCHLMQAKQIEAVEAEYVVFGFSCDQLTIELAQRWRLPEILLDSLRGENAHYKRVLSVMLAAQLVKVAEHGWYTTTMQDLLEQLADLLLSDSGSVATLVHQNAVRAARASHHLGVWHPAMALLHPVPLQHDDAPTHQAAPAAVTALADASPAPPAHVEEVEESGATPASVTAENEADFCLAPQRPVLDRVLHQLTNRDDKPLALRDILLLTLEGMHDGLGLNRVLFAMLTPDKGQLKARLVIGSDNDPSFNRFAVDLNAHNLFMRLLEKPRALWLDDNNRSEFFPLVPMDVQKILHNDSFYVMSLFIKTKPIGIFYADRHTRSCRLDEKSYKYFKHLVAQTSMCLAQLRR